MILTPLWLALLARPIIPDPCTLIAKADIQTFIGEPVATTAKADPEKDDDTGGTITTCTFMGKTKAVFVTVVEFKSAAEATKKITAQFITDKNEGSTVESEPGLGDRAWFGRSPNAAMIVTQKGARAVAVGIGGPGQDASKYRATLHKLIAGVAAKG